MAPTTSYHMDEGQVLIPDTAAERKGIQPVVHLHAEGEKKVEVKTGEAVILAAEVEVPDGAGMVETVQWDFEATNVFVEDGIVTLEDEGKRAKATVSHVFGKSGIYFPVVKVGSNRTPGNHFTRVMNLDRVRVVVTE